MPTLIDTHCHLDFPPIASRLDEVLEAGRGAGVSHVIVPGVDRVGWDSIAAVASRAASIHAAYGVHPQYADTFDDAGGEVLASLLPGAVAVGEIGLDYSPGYPDREVQKLVFREQLKLAIRHGLPVLLHCRRAFSDLLAILKEEGVAKVGGVMHAFSGSVETARECLRFELLVSVAGPITYANAVKPLDVARQIPLDRLLVETDSPDLTPDPFRSRMNEPAFLPLIARRLAELKGVPFEEVALRTTENAEALFRLN